MNEVGVLQFPDFKSYHKATVIKTMRYWHKDGYIDQQNRTESPEINSNKNGQIISDKCAKTISRGKDNFQQFALRKLDIYMQKNEVGSLPNTI